MIKKILITLIIGFGIINFSSAIDFTSAGNNTYWSGDINTEYLHGGYTYNVSNNLNFNTSISLLEGNLFYLEYISYIPASFSLSWANNELYFTSRRNQLNIQGTLNNWYVGPVSERINNSWYLGEKTFDVPTSAIIQARPDFKEYFFGVIGSTNDWVENIQAYYICFSDYVNDYCVACNISSCPSGINTGNSLVITDFSFDSLAAINWDSSPFVSSAGGGININTGSYAGNNGDFVNVACTNGNIKRFYEEAGYTKNLCYGGDYFWDLGTEDYSTEYLINGVGYNIFEIYEHLTGAIGTGNTYSTGNSIDVRFNYWRSRYGRRTNQYVSTNNPFSGYPQVLFGLFNFISRYGPTYQDKYILDYCNLLINSDLSASYEGPNSRAFHCNSQGIVDFTNVDGPGGGTGENSEYFGSSSWSGTFLGVGSGSLGSGKVYNFTTFMTNFFDIVSNVFNGLVGFEGRVGFLPRYIVATMLFLIVFRFLSH